MYEKYMPIQILKWPSLSKSFTLMYSANTTNWCYLVTTQYGIKWPAITCICFVQAEVVLAICNVPVSKCGFVTCLCAVKLCIYLTLQCFKFGIKRVFYSKCRSMQCYYNKSSFYFNSVDFLSSCVFPPGSQPYANCTCVSTYTYMIL